MLATQCLLQVRPQTMRITYEGEPGFGVTAKDLILGTIGQISAAGAVGHVVEYAGAPIEALSIEGRMTICNMSIEAGARAGMIAPDDVTFAYLEGRPGAPADFDAAVERWRSLPHRRRRRLRHRGDGRRRRAQPAGHLGHEPRAGRAGHRPRARSRRRSRAPPTARPPSARSPTWRSSPGTRDRGHRGRPRVHRLVHELADRGPARRRRGGARPAGRRRRCARWSCPARSR